MIPLEDNVEEMFIGPFGSSLKNECFVDEEDGFCMVYEQKHAIRKSMDVETRYVNEEKYNELKRFNIKGGDIIVSCRGTIGETYIIPADAPLGIMHPSIMKIRLKDGIYDKFYFNLLLRSRLRMLEAEANGSGIKMAISATALGKELFPIPTIKEQLKISNIISRITKIIEEREQELSDLDILIKSRFVEMFGSFIDSSVAVDFDSICEFVTVGIANSATHAFCDDGVVMFRNQNIKEDYLDASDIVHITPDFAGKYKSKMLKKDDLLIVRTGYPGVACLVPEQYEGCQTFTTLIARLKNEDTINSRFVCHYINSEYGKNYVKDNSAGAAQQNFGATALSKLPICIPPIELQNEYITFVEQTDKLKLPQIAPMLNRLIYYYFDKNHASDVKKSHLHSRFHKFTKLPLQGNSNFVNRAYKCTKQLHLI